MEASTVSQALRILFLLIQDDGVTLETQSQLACFIMHGIQQDCNHCQTAALWLSQRQERKSMCQHVENRPSRHQTACKHGSDRCDRCRGESHHLWEVNAMEFTLAYCSAAAQFQLASQQIFEHCLHYQINTQVVAISFPWPDVLLAGPGMGAQTQQHCWLVSLKLQALFTRSGLAWPSRVKCIVVD